MDGRVQCNATAEVNLESVRQANMLLWWTLRPVILEGRRRVVTCSIPDSASAQFFLYKITALPVVGESGKSDLFVKQLLHFPFVPRECNAVLRSLDSVCIFYHSGSNICLPLGNHLVHFPIFWHRFMTCHYEQDVIQFGYMI